MSMPQREMQRLSQVELHGNQVAAHSQAFVAYSRRSSREVGSLLEAGWDSVGHSGQNSSLNGHEETNHARTSTLAHLSQLQTILERPADFLQRLARQVCGRLCLWDPVASHMEEMPHTFFPVFVISVAYNLSPLFLTSVPPPPPPPLPSLSPQVPTLCHRNTTEV